MGLFLRGDVHSMYVMAFGVHCFRVVGDEIGNELLGVLRENMFCPGLATTPVDRPGITKPTARAAARASTSVSRLSPQATTRSVSAVTQHPLRFSLLLVLSELLSPQQTARASARAPA